MTALRRSWRSCAWDWQRFENVGGAPGLPGGLPLIGSALRIEEASAACDDCKEGRGEEPARGACRSLGRRWRRNRRKSRHGCWLPAIDLGQRIGQTLGVRI
jgi:hypothetical protein